MYVYNILAPYILHVQFLAPYIYVQQNIFSHPICATFSQYSLYYTQYSLYTHNILAPYVCNILTLATLSHAVAAAGDPQEVRIDSYTVFLYIMILIIRIYVQHSHTLGHTSRWR